MNQVTIREPSRNEQNKQKLMLLDYMADKYSLTADEFRKTVRATCGLEKGTPEQVAAFLIVAKEYNLNPLLKEIYAFAGRGGGVVPIVSIDGWVNLVNSHPQCDGFDFSVEDDDDGNLYSITCTMHRKDRKHPTVVTEYLSECIRSTEPWKMKHRMLRHKAFIQAARYAFGFAGIYDEDEGRTIAEATDVTPLRVPSPSEVETKVIDTVPEKPDPISSGPAPKKSNGPNIDNDYEGFIAWAFDQIKSIDDPGALETFLVNEVQAQEKTLFPTDFQDIVDSYNCRQTVLNSEE